MLKCWNAERLKCWNTEMLQFWYSETCQVPPLDHSSIVHNQTSLQNKLEKTPILVLMWSYFTHVIIIRDCSQIMLAIFGGVWTPPPFPLCQWLSAIGWTPPPAFVSDCQHMAHPPFPFVNNVSIWLTRHPLLYIYIFFLCSFPKATLI